MIFDIRRILQFVGWFERPDFFCGFCGNRLTQTYVRARSDRFCNSYCANSDQINNSQ